MRGEPAEAGEPSGELPAVRARRAPDAPTKQEIEDHAVSHEPFRAWCPSCVAGRARSDPHVARKDTSDDALTVIGIDYGFMPPKGVADDDPDLEKKASPILVGRDRKHRWTFAMAVPCKGTGTLGR